MYWRTRAKALCNQAFALTCKRIASSRFASRQWSRLSFELLREAAWELRRSSCCASDWQAGVKRLQDAQRPVVTLQSRRFQCPLQRLIFSRADAPALTQTATLASLLDVLNSTKSSDIAALVRALSVDEQDALMKFIYKGLGTPETAASSVLLGWHEKVSGPRARPETGACRCRVLRSADTLYSLYSADRSCRHGLHRSRHDGPPKGVSCFGLLRGSVIHRYRAAAFVPSLLFVLLRLSHCSFRRNRVKLLQLRSSEAALDLSRASDRFQWSRRNTLRMCLQTQASPVCLI